MTKLYLPKAATVVEACEWLEAKTGKQWTLPRLLESGLTPWFWLDYKPGLPETTTIFGDRVEGYLAPMAFGPDIRRLEADGTEALVNMTRTHDGNLMKVIPGMRVPLAELRFKRESIMRKASQDTAPLQNTGMPAPMVPESGTDSNEAWKVKARACAHEIIKRDKERDLYPSQKNIADEIAKQFRRDGLTGADGKPLTGAYIKRHALNGISSAQKKRTSTAIRRSK